MNKIKLYNRDGADLWLEEEFLVEPHISQWKLHVDKEHEYCLKYIRVIGDYESVDPSGGPMISIGDEFENKYKIVKIISGGTFWISERDSNN